MVITQDEYNILVITQVQAKPKMSVNNQDIMRMYLGYNWLITQKTLPINAFFVNSKQWLQVMFTYQSFFWYKQSIPLIFSQVVSTYRPRIDIYLSVLWLVYHSTKLFDVWLHWVISSPIKVSFGINNLFL